ncbi:MAG: WYL domain-containing protein [Bacteroidetes bacterium]|jgi:predicted DNA-binding transcriptional regulator YafY|nr:WYL domain-containing protein [Bacteroidota bacterium]
MSTSNASSDAMARSDRRLALVRLLQEQRWQRAVDLGEAVGASPRTIYRDMRALKDAGVPVEAVPGQGYRLREDALLSPLRLTTDEAVVLLLSTEHAADHLDVNYQAAAHAARAKLEALLPDRLRSEVAALRSSVHAGPANAFDASDEQTVLDVLRRALTESRTVRCQHRSADGAKRTGRVDPYGLVRFGGAWHLVGYSHERDRVLHIRLRDIERPELLEATFERPAGYRSHRDPTRRDRPLTVRVRFAPEVAHWVREAPSAHLVDTEERPDGLYVTLQVQRETEVLPWLLSWGAHAQVLEPPSLRRRLAREAAAIAERHQSEPTLLP